jgi:hypothetical protein
MNVNDSINDGIAMRVKATQQFFAEKNPAGIGHERLE